MDMTVPAAFVAQSMTQYKVGMSLEKMAIRQDQAVADLVQSAQISPQTSTPPAHRGQVVDILA